MSNKTKLPPMKFLRPPKRSSIERRHCSDPERFTFALVRATAQMERAKRKERKAERASERRVHLMRKATRQFGALGVGAIKATDALKELISASEALPQGSETP